MPDLRVNQWNWLRKSVDWFRSIPQGLKPRVLCGFLGTTEVVPFRDGVRLLWIPTHSMSSLRKSIEWMGHGSLFLAALNHP
jgi:hypothetical protein